MDSAMQSPGPAWTRPGEGEISQHTRAGRVQETVWYHTSLCRGMKSEALRISGAVVAS